MKSTRQTPPASSPTLAETKSPASFKLERVSRLCRRNRRGAAVVEFALIAPVLFLLAFGIIEFGRMVMVQQVLTNASREGARLATLDGTTRAEFDAAVAHYLDSAAVPSASASFAPDPALPTSDDYVGSMTVTVSIPFDQVSWLPSPLFLGGRTLTATAVMRRENTQ